MGKWILWALLPVLLCGCGREETFEIVSDEAVVPVMASPRQIAVDLPEDAVSPVLDQEGEQIYLCDGYDIFIHTTVGLAYSVCTAPSLPHEPHDIPVHTVIDERRILRPHGAYPNP